MVQPKVQLVDKLVLPEQYNSVAQYLTTTLLLFSPPLRYSREAKREKLRFPRLAAGQAAGPFPLRRPLRRRESVGTADLCRRHVNSRVVGPAGGEVVAGSSSAGIMVLLLFPHHGGALRGGVKGRTASYACGSGGSTSLRFQGVVGEAGSAAAPMDFVLQLLPPRSGVPADDGVGFVRSCIGGFGRKTGQELGGGLKVVDPVSFPDVFGGQRRIWKGTSVGKFPGRHATAIMASPLADLFFGSESLCGDGADSSSFDGARWRWQDPCSFSILCSGFSALFLAFDPAVFVFGVFCVRCTIVCNLVLG